MDKLLPCAHCGGKAKIEPTKGEWEGYKMTSVYCQDCGASRPSHDKWNTRHIPEGYVLVPKEPTEEDIKIILSAYTTPRKNAEEIRKAIIASYSEEKA